MKKHNGEIKHLGIRVPKALHSEVKEYCEGNGLLINDFIIKIIKKELRSAKEI